jgi:RIO-like serine/threonine protein kinase
MFDPGTPRFARARRTDAISSHEAAAELERTGNGRLQAERVLAALRKYPMSTSAELAQFAGLKRQETARRLPELMAAGLVMRYDVTAITAPCTVGFKRAIRWCAI